MRYATNIAACIIAVVLTCTAARAKHARQYLDTGWQQLVHDNDTEAFKTLKLAYDVAREEHDGELAAQSLLYMGICSYGTSYSNGLRYASAAMAEYKKLAGAAPSTAEAGRLKCLQLISTIYSRQGKYTDAIALSQQVLNGFTTSQKDEEGYAGLAATSLGDAYKALGNKDSTAYYYRMALADRSGKRNFVYLPSALINVAEIELAAGNKEMSYGMYDRALYIADSTTNRQAQVAATIGMGKWHLAMGNMRKAEEWYTRALAVSATLADKSFRLKALSAFGTLYRSQGNFARALAFEDSIATLKDSLNNWEKDRVTKSLEVQFRTQEKEQELVQTRQQHKITVLTNYVLWGTLALIVFFSLGIIFLLRRINQRDKQLLAAKESLIQAINEEKRQKELLMQNEIEFKESQLSALVLQMQQKNELMQELKDRIEQDTKTAQDTTLNKIISKGVNHDKEWNDFNTYFESINKNFYSKIKTAYPDISPNDLKICALIKLNMSTKEMAGILNISPDSVKTARYRLRKKLQLETEDNLTGFILSI